MTASFKDPAANELAEFLARMLGIPVETILADVRARQAAHARKVARQNERYANALACTTRAQAETVAKLRAEGYVRQNGIRQHRDTGNIVIFMHKRPIWDGAKGRMGVKLVAVYPDGTRAETFERSISVRPNF